MIAYNHSFHTENFKMISQDYRYFLLGSESYASAVEAIAGANSVLVYCGAGLSYPFTGLTWNNLILDMLDNIKHELNRLPHFRESSDAYDTLKRRLAENVAKPQENATILAKYIDDLANANYGKFDYFDKLADTIGMSLYRKISQSENSKFDTEPCFVPRYTGNNLFEHITSLVLAFLKQDKKIRIVTTNYDTFLEDSLNSAFSNLRRDGDSYSTRTYGSEGRSNLTRLSGKRVPIVYLHGRIARNRKNEKGNLPFNQLVFSEDEYYSSQRRTVEILKKVSKPVDCVLVVGASLNDPPLLEWMHSNKGNSGKEYTKNIIVVQAIEQDRYAVTPLTDEERFSIVHMTQTRYNSIGVSHYVPVRCFSDLSYVIRDAIIKQKDGMETADSAVPSVTRKQLIEWTSNLSANLNNRSTLQKISKELLKNVGHARELLSALLLNKVDKGKSNFPLKVRLEYWVRGIFPHESDPDYLVKVADSSSFALDFQNRRSESFFRRFPSRVAAVRAVQFDKAELVTLEELGQCDHASRWQAFYSAPIRSDITISDFNLPVNTGAFVAAVQLDELDHEFFHSDMRAEFSRIVSESSRRFEYGDMNKDELFAFIKLEKFFRNLSLSIDDIIGLSVNDQKD